MTGSSSTHLLPFMHAYTLDHLHARMAVRRKCFCWEYIKRILRRHINWMFSLHAAVFNKTVPGCWMCGFLLRTQHFPSTVVPQGITTWRIDYYSLVVYGTAGQDFMLGKVTVTKYTATGKSSDDTINHRLMSNSHPTIVYLHGEAIFTAKWRNCGPLFCFHSSILMSSEATNREALSLVARLNDKQPLSHPISIK